MAENIWPLALQLRGAALQGKGKPRDALRRGMGPEKHMTREQKKSTLLVHNEAAAKALSALQVR